MNKFLFKDQSKYLFVFVFIIISFFVFTKSSEAAGCSGTGACYWVGGSGNTNDTAYWADSSGGAVTGGLPTSADDCIFDSASSANSYTVTVNANLTCKNMSWTNPASGSPTFTGNAKTVYIYGSLSLVSGMTTNTLYIAFDFNSTGSETITTNGVSLYGLYFRSGNYTLMDNLTFLNNATVGLYFYNNAILDMITHTTTVTFPLGGTISYGQNNTFYNLAINSGNYKTMTLTLTTTGINVSNNLTIAGNSSVNRIFIKSNTVGSPRDIKANNISISNADFRDIYVAPYNVNRVIVAMGDSITHNGNYPSDLQTLIQSYSGFEWSIANAGVAGNTTTEMLARFTTDVINVSGVEYVIILGGINDIVGDISAATIESNLQAMYDVAHANGLTVAAVTITPFKTNQYWTQARQDVLDSVNTWIKSHPTNVDYVVDAFTALEDPAAPDTLLATYAGPDYLHPVTAGYTALANAVYAETTWVQASSGLWDLSESTGGSGDCGGNSRITFTNSQNNYWYKASGSANNWSTVGNWYLGSGGTSGAGRVSLCQDTATFDSSSFGSSGMTLTQDMPRVGSVLFGNIQNSPTFTTSTAASVFGSLTLAPVANWNFSASTQLYTFEGRSSYTLTTNGNTWAKNLTLSAPNGTLALADTPTMGSSNTFTVSKGTLNANYKVMTVAPNTAFTLSGGTLNLYNNVFYRSSALGTLISESSGTLNLKNNIFYNILDVLSSSGGTNSISNNIYYNSSDEGGSGSLTSDPQFVSAGSDFTLQPTSPAINAGADVGLTIDLNGVSVPQGVSPDIGAYEFPASLAPTINAPTALSSSSIRWNFTDNANNEIGFRIYDNTNTEIVSSATVDLNYLDEIGLLENTQYLGRYAVAYNELGDSSPSSTVSSYTLADTPTNLSATSNLTSVSLTVDSFPNDTSDLSGYYFSRSGVNSGWIQTNSWQDTGLTCGTSYDYSVIYRNGDGIETAPISITKSTSTCIVSYTLTYTAGVHGTISGSTPQTVNSGADGTQITAVPDAGYHFVDWSDAVTTESRTDTNITGNISVTANFAVDMGSNSSGSYLSDYGPRKILTTPSVATTVPVISEIQKVTKDLKLGMINNDVKTLQLFLISQNKGIAAKDLAKYNGTYYFGKLTKNALAEWQKANNIIPSVGYFGKITRAKIKLLNL